MRKIYYPFLFWLIILIGFSTHSLYGLDANYKIRRMSPDGGLGANGQRDVKQDKWGFIWIITVNDLYRFDGYTFKYYTDKLNKKDSALVWSFDRLEVDKGGGVYVASNQGLIKYNPSTDNFDYLYNKRVTLVEEDKKGRLWIVSHDSIGFFDRERLHFNPIVAEREELRNISAISAKDELIFVGTQTGEVYQYDENKGDFKKVFNESTDNIVDIKYKERSLYVLTENKGLLVISLDIFKEEKFYDFFYPDGDMRVSARSLFFDKHGLLWITTQRGIYIMNVATGEYRRFLYDKTDSFGMPSNSVWKISEDNQGNLWFGTYSGGLCFVNINEKKKFKTFNGLTDDLSNPVVSSFEENERYLWIGTEGGGLNRYDKNSGLFTYYKHSSSRNSLSYDNIQSLLFVNQDNLWIGMSRGGLDHLNLKTEQFTHYSVANNALLNDHVERLVAEADSGLWIKYLMNSDQLTYLSLKDYKSKHFNMREFSNQLRGNINDIQRGAGDTLWIASNNNLFVMNVRTKATSAVLNTTQENESLSSINIISFLVDDDRQLIWIGTNGNGLLVYDKKSRTLNKIVDISKYNAYLIYSINQDNEGNLWFGTNNGLFSLNVETKILQQFGKNDGAQGQTCYPHATFKSQSGKLYFGGNEGFTVVDTGSVFFNTYAPNVIITDFLLDNTPVISGEENSPLKSSIFQTDKLDLKYNQNNFSFVFTSSNYHNPDKNRFRYRLKGYDDKWIETDANHRVASYVKVPKGNYIFEIMTANNDGVCGKLLFVEVNVNPAPWASSWAITGYVIVLMALVLMIIQHFNKQRKQKMQFYIEEQEKKQKEEYHQAQLKFFTNVSHDFRTPLSLILAALDFIKRGDVIEKHLSVLENNAKRLLALINELMDFRSLQNKKVKLFLQKEDWNRFVDRISVDFTEYAEQRKILFCINHDSTMLAELYFDKTIVEKIILNLLNNSFKYTDEGGTVSVSTLADIHCFKSSYTNCTVVKADEKVKDMFGLVIRDSGVGISEASIRLIFDRYYRIDDSGGQHLGSGIGLALVKSLVELHKGYIAIYSERGRGSDIVIGFSSDSSVYNDEDFKNEKEEISLSDSKTYYDLEGGCEPVEEYAQEASQRSDKTVLLVEDNADLRELLMDMLREYYEVKYAKDGADALKIIENERVDLVVTDVMMPGMNGIELTKTIKNDMATSHIPIIMLTARAGSENQIEGLRFGADLYFEKPVNQKVLLLSISNLFKQQLRIKEYYSKYFFTQSNHEAPHINKRDEEFMQNLVNIIELNLSNTEIDVMQIASSLAMSRRTLYGKVKTLTGQSVVEFIRNYRLKRAAQILMEDDLSIVDVMEKVGIANASYFSRIFKQEFGETPTEFVANHRK